VIIFVESIRSFEFWVFGWVCKVAALYRDWQVWSDNVVLSSISPAVCTVTLYSYSENHVAATHSCIFITLLLYFITLHFNFILFAEEHGILWCLWFGFYIDELAQNIVCLACSVFYCQQLPLLRIAVVDCRNCISVSSASHILTVKCRWTDMWYVSALL